MHKKICYIYHYHRNHLPKFSIPDKVVLVGAVLVSGQVTVNLTIVYWWPNL